MELVEKVKQVIQSNQSAYEIEKVTGVSRVTINNMKKNSEYDFSKMSLQVAEKLGAYFDENRATSSIFQDGGGFITFTSLIDRWFNEVSNDSVIESLDLKDEQKLAFEAVINKLSNQILADMDKLQELYSVYKEKLTNN